MNIRNLIMSALVLFMTLVTTVCFAKISVGDLEIGGIYYGQPLSEVINRFGEPTMRVSTSPKGHSCIWKKGNVQLNVYSPENKNGYVAGVGTTFANFLTKAGIGVGASLADVKAVYGEPDKIYELMEGGDSITYQYVGDALYLEFVVKKSSNTVSGLSFGGSGNIKGSNSSKPSPQTQTRPASTIPKSVQEMPESEFYIGGITVGQTFDYVEQIYGKPGKIDDEGFFQTYNYNDRFIVKGKLNNGYKVCSVAIYEKGLTTPSGFTGETPYEAVTKKYGVGHETKFKAEGLEAKLKGCKDYTYFCNNKQMVFLVDKKGVIKAVRVEERDDQKFIEAKRKK